MSRRWRRGHAALAAHAASLAHLVAVDAADSQGRQADILDALFGIIGATNKEYVEFGYNSRSLCSGSGANTCRLWRKGWRGLLLDGGNRNESINLHQEMISSANIVHLLRRYGVSEDVDSIYYDVPGQANLPPPSDANKKRIARRYGYAVCHA